MKRYIPNTITCCSLASGFIASVLALQGEREAVVIWVIIAALFDFMDGFAARLLKAFSPIGKELDSLSDVISFGVAPGLMLYDSLKGAAPFLPFGSWNTYVAYLAFIIPVFSALRLAKFNIDTRQTTSFLGLPVPAHALFWTSILYAARPFAQANPVLFVAGSLLLALVSSLLLVSELPMFSMKVKSFAWQGNEMRYILAACAILFVSLWGILGIAGTILLYVVLSLLNYYHHV
ncbi:MAG: CDP-alcohol phosphatidyltransferase family protein [Parabacteroides sp.]